MEIGALEGEWWEAGRVVDGWSRSGVGTRAERIMRSGLTKESAWYGATGPRPASEAGRGECAFSILSRFVQKTFQTFCRLSAWDELRPHVHTQKR